MLIKAGFLFFSPKSLSLACLVLTCFPPCRYVESQLANRGCICRGAFLFSLLSGFSEEGCWFPACEGLLNWHITEANTIVGCILFQPVAFHIQEKNWNEKFWRQMVLMIAQQCECT